LASSGLDHLYHARFDEAKADFERIHKMHPRHPAGKFFLGGLEWHRLTTGPSELIASESGSAAFFAHMDEAISLGEDALKANSSDASARFFLGGAYGYEARYLALRERWWDAYQKGKRGVGHLERVVKDRPDFGDAYLGLGIYHYYADVIPGVLKLFGKVAGMDGDKKRGLEEIHRSLREGTIVQPEARFFLAEIYSTFEEDHWRALDFSRTLRDEYPENELFAWINARVLDELHLTDLASREWSWLRTKAEGPGHRGFLEYRLARTRLYSGDFAGAATQLEELLQRGALGSRRMAMWARLRLGMALDFLGRHEEAIEQYRKAHDMKASSTAEERAEERISAAKKNPAAISLLELQEMARILKDTRTHGEKELRMLEDKLTGPSRGLSKSKSEIYYGIARDLAEARMRRGDPAACIAAIDRLNESHRDAPKEEKANLLELRARALARLGRIEDALRDLKAARPRASWDMRQVIDRERETLSRGNPYSEAAVSPTASQPTVQAPDRGELTLETEVLSPNGQTVRIPMALQGASWVSTTLPESSGEILYRFVANGLTARIDPSAPRSVMKVDQAWSVYPKQTNSSVSP
jgi:tetratricopeptide (TPR) repeat protein